MAPRVLLVAALAACDGTAGIADAGPDAPATPAGVWRGTTGEGGPLSFIVSEDGTVTDAAVELIFTLPSGDPCVVELRAVSPAPSADGVAHLALRGEGLNFQVPLELRFDDVRSASGTLGGFSGPFRVDCGLEPIKGEGDILPASPLVAAKTAEVSAPRPKDVPLISAAPAAVPVGFLEAGCSHQPGSARVFCAFATRAADGRAQLWVVEPARLQGPCPGAGCLKLTDDLWMDERTSYGFSFDHGFAGDTLLFRADPLSSGTFGFEGPMYAWRPGWSAPLRLVDNAWLCQGDETSDAVFCLDDFASGPDGVEANLFAGRLGDGKVPLRGVERILLESTPDIDEGISYWLYQVELAGQTLLWSARPRARAPETLHALDLGDPRSAPRTLGTHVTQWSVSGDGTRLYWQRPTDVAGARMSNAGALEMIALPAGGDPRPVAANAAEHLEVRDGAVRRMVVRDPDGGLLLQRNVDAPSTTVLDRGVTGIRAASGDGHFLAYDKNVPGQPDALVTIAELDGIACVPRAVGWSNVVFSSSGRFAMASHWDFQRGARTVEVIDSRTCASAVVSLDGQVWRPLPGDRFLLLSHALELRRFGVVDASLVESGAPPAVTLLQPSVSGQISVTAGMGATDIVFSIDGGWRSDGLYHRTLPAKRR